MTPTRNCGLRIADCGLKTRNPKSLPCRQAGEIRNPKSPVFLHLNGQSIVEYLIVATAVIAAIMFFKTPVQNAMNGLYGEATNQVWNAANQLQALAGGGGSPPSCDCAVFWWCCR